MAAGASEASTRVASPFRWAGGKRWLIPTIRELLGDTVTGAYHEPFLGAASVFFGLSQFSKAFLSDTNAELIATFRAIRDHPDEVAEQASEYANDKDTYYAVRASAPKDKVGRAARFLYLNHTSFNGIYRVNLAGVYNVPFGHGRTARIPTADHLREVSARLRNATLQVDDFEGCLAKVKAGHLVFLDPPYTVAHNQNGFVKYNQRLFSFEDQRRLSKVVDQIKKRRAYYVLANAAHQSIGGLRGCS